jgi:uncharacterized membrane protein
VAANTYNCVAYMASGTALFIGKALSLPPLVLFEAGRMVNGVALMPMTLAQAASFSADAASFATTFLLIAYILKLAFDERVQALGWREIFTLTLLAVGKPL